MAEVHIPAQLASDLRFAARSESTVQLGENPHGSRVSAGHLNSECGLDFVLRRCGFDPSESRIDVGFLVA